MNLKQSFQMAFKSIRSNRVRSLLTMLGIIIGVAAVIIMVSVAVSYTHLDVYKRQDPAWRSAGVYPRGCPVGHRSL